MMESMDYKKIFSEVAEELGIDQLTVEQVYKAYWKYIKNTIEALPLKKPLTRESFRKLNTGFNITHLGKLHCSYKGLLRIKKKYNEGTNNKED